MYRGEWTQGFKGNHILYSAKWHRLFQWAHMFSAPCIVSQRLVSFCSTVLVQILILVGSNITLNYITLFLKGEIFNIN
jgi:hypothetical protein